MGGCDAGDRGSGDRPGPCPFPYARFVPEPSESDLKSPESFEHSQIEVELDRTGHELIHNTLEEVGRAPRSDSD